MPEAIKKGIPYVEVPRHDEQPAGIAAPVQAEARTERHSSGRWARGARTAQSKGGKQRRGKSALVVVGGKAARSLRRVLCREVSSTVGGGVCGAAPSLFLRWAADKAAMAEKAKKADDTDRFCKLTESARMDIVYAHERAAKAAAVGSSSGPSAHEVLAKALLEPETGRAK